MSFYFSYMYSQVSEHGYDCKSLYLRIGVISVAVTSCDVGAEYAHPVVIDKCLFAYAAYFGEFACSKIMVFHRTPLFHFNICRG